MKDKFIIGIDIGTQGVKTSLFHISGKIAAEAFEPSILITDNRGNVEQDPEEIYSSVINTIRQVMEKSGAEPSEIASIGIDGQMAGIMGIDKNWNAVTPYDSWLDTKCEKYILKMKEAAEEQIIKTTGCPVTYAHGPKVLWWKNERPEVYSNTAKFIMLSTYVAGRLAGLKAKDAYIDYTHIHFSGFCDTEKKEWSEELVKEFRIDNDKLPEIVEPWKVVGKLLSPEAEKCSLAEGTPVVAGCGDQAATSLGAGIIKQGMVFDVAGTASVFSCCVDSFKPDVKNKTLLFPRAVIDGLWIPLAYINGGGLCLKWFRDNLAEKETTYGILDSETEKIAPGSEGLVFIPHFAGRVCPNMPNMRGGWFGLNFNHGRGHLFKAVMESIAYEYRIYMDILKELTDEKEFSHVFVMGGGSQSGIFNKIKADVLGLPYIQLERASTATLGSAIVAGYASGIYADMAETADKMTETGKTFYPDSANREIYRKQGDLYGRYLNLLEKKDEADGSF